MTYIYITDTTGFAGLPNNAHLPGLSGLPRERDAEPSLKPKRRGTPQTQGLEAHAPLTFPEGL